MSDPYSANTILLLHMEGSNGSTTFTDSSALPKTITCYGDAKISTAQSKWGQGSGYFDGNGDYLKIDESSDLNLLSGDFTIELFLKNENPNTTNGGTVLCVGGGSGYWQWIVRQNKLLINSFSGTYYDFIANQTLDTNWHHLAWTKSESTHRLFYDGVLLSASGTPPTGAPSSLQGYVGANYNGGTTSLTGYIQDLRIIKGLARYTDNFTPPTAKLPDPDPVTALILPTTLRHDMEDYGNLSVIEPVTRMNSPVSRRVRLCDQRSGRLVREGWSDPITGLITFANLREGPWVLYSLDHTGEFEAVAISDRVATVGGARP